MKAASPQLAADDGVGEQCNESADRGTIANLAPAPNVLMKDATIVYVP